ncbi:DUF1128 family protein [Gracilibacillus halotolerans]|uniref:DUF1128 family protein n=1 Tax=Gracilibacillus halotolerans TaxID=74386 RepID=UPI0031B5E742
MKSLNLDVKSEENLTIVLKEMGKKLQVANADSLMNPDDYKLESYDELKSLYDLLVTKEKLTVSETHAFIDELRKHRK